VTQPTNEDQLIQAATEKFLADLNKEKTPARPGATRTQLINGWIIPFRGNESGEWEVDTTQQPTRYLPEAGGGAPHVLVAPTRGRGAVVWNEAEQQFQEIPDTALPPTEPSYHYDPSGAIYQGADVVGYNPVTVARLQAQEDRAARKEVVDATKAEGDAFIDRLNALRQAKQIDDAEAERQWNRWYKENVEAPQAQAKFRLDLAQEERANVTAAQAAGERAGEAATKDIVAQIPYQFSGGFLERRRQGLEAAQRGMYGPATAAGPITMPNLGAARAAAAQQGQTAAAGQLGIDLAPDVLSQVPAYGGPPPASAAFLSAEEDAADWARRLTGARERLGPAPLAPAPPTGAIAPSAAPLEDTDWLRAYLRGA
jgi:hypothetical protein